MRTPLRETAPVELSVVIPCHNYADRVGAAIDSVLASRRPADEIVVVDDGSTDHSARVIAAYPSATLVEQPNGGMASALNRGIAESSGDVLVLLDADDLMDAERLAWIEEAFSDPGVVMAWHPLRITDDSGSDRGLLPGRPLPSGDLGSQIARHGLTSFAVTSGLAVRRSALDAVGPIPEDRFRNFGDGYLVRTVPFVGMVRAESEALGTYTSHSGSDSKRHARADLDSMAAQLAHRLEMADREHEVIVEWATAAGHRVMLGGIRSTDLVYQDLFVAHERLTKGTRRDAWRSIRDLEIARRRRFLLRATLYLAVPKGLVMFHQLVRSGEPDLPLALRPWSVLYWRAARLRDRLDWRRRG